MTVASSRFFHPPHVLCVCVCRLGRQEGIYSRAAEMGKKSAARRTGAALDAGTEIACRPARVESCVARPRGRGFHRHGSTLAMFIQYPFRRSHTPGASRERIKRRRPTVSPDRTSPSKLLDHTIVPVLSSKISNTPLKPSLFPTSRNSDDMAMAWPVAVRSQETRSAEGSMRRRGSLRRRGYLPFLFATGIRGCSDGDGRVAFF